ncbi:ammonium transporter 3 member 1-like [Olea europaea subsp. europaea]|uniref:Ammonium transporter 3 member 1-like n=1 Tax=Olea europaea subsp. europaea TaxID=158383 RepID=A0A8S0TFK1_OLEEU|nr:ammonium transporter 3 member 1-like [Olea europaea subsp. europaea]
MLSGQEGDTKLQSFGFMALVIEAQVRFVVPLRMTEEDMEVGDEAAHGEEAYAIWGQGERSENSRFSTYNDMETGASKSKDHVEMTSTTSY